MVATFLRTNEAVLRPGRDDETGMEPLEFEGELRRD